MNLNQPPTINSDITENTIYVTLPAYTRVFNLIKTDVVSQGVYNNEAV